METHNPDKETGTVWYYKSWCRIHLILGLIFSFIFILGALALNNYIYLLYLLLSFNLIFMGYQRLKWPYIEYSQTRILVRGNWGYQSKKYNLGNNDRITYHKNRLYLNDQKLKLNHWFTNLHDWKRFINFFIPKHDDFNELQD